MLLEISSKRCHGCVPTKCVTYTPKKGDWQKEMFCLFVWGIEIYLHSFLTSALDECDQLDSRFIRLILWEIPLYQLNERIGRPHSMSGRCKEEENFLPLPGIEPRFPLKNSVAWSLF